MCSGSKSEPCSSNLTMESKSQSQKDEVFYDSSVLLELSASDDVEAFRREVERKGFDVDQPSLWYGRGVGLKKMGFEERTPLMIAALYGSTNVVKYIVESGKVDVNRGSRSDGVTALHCATSGGSISAAETVKLLLDAFADVNSVNADGKKPIDLIAPAFKSLWNSRRKALEMLLKGDNSVGDNQEEEKLKITTVTQSSKEGADKKEFPIDISLPDINNGIYGTDEFRMYTFKVKPCSRAYSHDWTECPFVHPGENARRRDPRKYPYSCVPCPEFRKGTCEKGDACEYSHGVFESWLHPAQYRTRLCKDETGCARKVCFFAHKPEELRPVYASTGSAMPTHRSLSVSSADMALLSPSAHGPSSMSLTTTSSPLMSPLAAASSPKNESLWQNKLNLTPPVLQLPGSRLKSTLSARDFELEMELLGLGRHPSQHQHQQLIDEISRLSSPTCWSKDSSRNGELKPNNLDDVFGSLDSSILSQFQGLSPRSSMPSQSQSSTGLPIRQNMNQLRASYPSNLSSSPVRKPSSFGFDSPGSMAAAVMNSRSAAFAKRSQSFIDRSAATHLPGFTASSSSAGMMSSNLSDWGSPDGKLNWAVQGDELNKLKKSASFGIRNNNAGTTNTNSRPLAYEPDVSWVHSLVKDVPPENSRLLIAEKQRYNLNEGVHETLPSWVEQLYIEQEQMVA